MSKYKIDHLTPRRFKLFLVQGGEKGYEYLNILEISVYTTH